LYLKRRSNSIARRFFFVHSPGIVRRIDHEATKRAWTNLGKIERCLKILTDMG
jgi:hypothetical protein